MSVRPRSVRMRLTLWYALALALTLGAYAVGIHVMLSRMLMAELRNQAEQDIQYASGLLEENEGKLFWDEDADRENIDREKPLVEVIDKTGQTLFRSPKYKHINEHAYVIVSRESAVDGFPDVVIFAARPLKPVKSELKTLDLILGLGIPIAVLLAGSIGYILARRALKPVDRMAERARAITAERLSEQLPVENPDDELGRLAATFNETFGRLEKSFEQLRRFTADASHELRTPLTAIRSVGEVGLRERRNSEEYQEVIGSMLEESDRLARLIDSLLTLSRADGGQIDLKREKLDAAALAADVIQQMSALAEEKSQTIRLEVAGPVMVEADPLMLRQSLVNLLDNAIKYSAENSEIRVSVSTREGRPVIDVADNGPGISPEHLPRIFDRFYRIDTARSREMGGAGLGLSIVRWVVEAHGGSINVQSEMNKGSRFTIVLPA